MKYTVAIIGTGGISRSHGRGFTEHPRCEIIAVADVRPENAAAFGEEFGVETQYADYGKLLAEQHPDIVCICTWPGTHAEIAIAAAEAGVKGILCEKPIARDLCEVDAMLAAADGHGAKLAVGHHQRFNPQIVAARRLIAEGAIGEPTLLRWATAGGLLNNCSHGIDRMRFVQSDATAVHVIAQVERRTDRYERGEPVEDLAGGIIVWSNGARSVLESDMPVAGWPGDVPVYGTEGMLVFGKEVRLLNGDGWQTIAGDPSPTQHEEFVTWLDGESDHRNDVHQNRHSVEIEMAIYESARRRGLVTLPLEPGPQPLLQMIERGDLPVETPGRYDIRAR